jgi:hypothetical protein
MLKLFCDINTFKSYTEQLQAQLNEQKRIQEAYRMDAPFVSQKKRNEAD